jgi:hypothetical protein
MGRVVQKIFTRKGTRFPGQCCPSRLPQWPVTLAGGAQGGCGFASPPHNLLCARHAPVTLE